MTLKRKALRSFHFLLLTAGAGAFLCHLLLANTVNACVLYISAMLCAFPLSLIPGTISKKRTYPLRVPVTGAVGIGFIIASYLFFGNGLFFIRPLLAGLICGVMIFFSVRESCLEYPSWLGQQSAVIGSVLYLVPGVILTFEGDPFLKSFEWIGAIVFFVFSALFLNDISMKTGLATRLNAKPPRSLKRGNRLLTIIFILIASCVVFWNQLRQGTTTAARWLLQKAIEFILWISSFFPSGTSSGGGSQSDPGEMMAGFGESVESPFWKALEKVAIGAAIIIGAALIVLLVYFSGKYVRKLWRRLLAYMRDFNKAAGDDYTDEQVDLFDFDDLRQQAGERIRKAIRKLTVREKKWEDMTAREKVRYCVRLLYKRSGEKDMLRSYTISEAAPHITHGKIADRDLTDLYNAARYSDEDIEPQKAEALRKAVK